jgi:hypothetical protein
MSLRPYRRNLVVLSQSAGPARRRDVFRLTRTGRIRRWIRLGTLLTLIAARPVARAVRPRWRLLLAGTVLTVVGYLMRGGAGGVALLPGFMFLLTAPLTQADPVLRTRPSELERELAGYSTPAQRRDFEAILDRYPDGVTGELRDILARQASQAGNVRLPGGGQY